VGRPGIERDSLDASTTVPRYGVTSARKPSQGRSPAGPTAAVQGVEPGEGRRLHTGVGPSRPRPGRRSCRHRRAPRSPPCGCVRSQRALAGMHSTSRVADMLIATSADSSGCQPEDHVGRSNARYERPTPRHCTVGRAALGAALVGLGAWLTADVTGEVRPAFRVGSREQVPPEAEPARVCPTGGRLNAASLPRSTRTHGRPPLTAAAPTALVVGNSRLAVRIAVATR
jgi:hypothetical protein